MEDVLYKSCKHWDRQFPQNRELGVCRKIGVLLAENTASIVLRENVDPGPPTSDVDSTRTLAHFGCIGHTRRGELLTSREIREYKQRR